MSRPIAAALASGALFASLAYSPAAALEAVAGTQLVMHIGPGAEHRNIGTIPAETHLTVHGCSDAERWCLVRFEGRHGWVEGESLSVVGFSRPAKTPVVAPAPQVVPVPVPVPVAIGLPLATFVTADDIIVGMGEQVGRAAFIPRTRKAVDLKKRHRAGAVFKRHHVRHAGHIGKRGHLRHPHLAKPGFHHGRKLHVSRGHFAKHRPVLGPGKRPGHGLPLAKPGTRFAKDLHVSRGHFAERSRFLGHGKRFKHGLHFGKPPKQRFVKRGKGFGHSANVRFTGLRVKGGWRP
jgi:uncharacterized protein YraI